MNIKAGIEKLEELRDNNGFICFDEVREILLAMDTLTDSETKIKIIQDQCAVIVSSIENRLKHLELFEDDMKKRVEALAKNGRDGHPDIPYEAKEECKHEWKATCDHCYNLVENCVCRPSVDESTYCSFCGCHHNDGAPVPCDRKVPNWKPCITCGTLTKNEKECIDCFKETIPESCMVCGEFPAYCQCKPTQSVKPSVEECKHEWSRPATGISYQFCLKDGCNAQRGDIIDDKPTPSVKPSIPDPHGENKDREVTKDYCMGWWAGIEAYKQQTSVKPSETISIPMDVAKMFIEQFKPRSTNRESASTIINNMSDAIESALNATGEIK